MNTLQVPPGSPWWLHAAAGAILFLHIAGGSIALVAGAAARLAVVASGMRGGTLAGYGAEGFGFVAGLFALAAALDLKVILGGGVSGIPRIARHLWRMCIGLFIAAGSFFLGQQKVMPEFVQGSPLLVIPPFAVLALMTFWLLRLRFARLAGRFAGARCGSKVAA